MSQKATRKSQAAAVSEDKEKGSDGPVKDMKKKMAANAEKEKLTAEKSDKNAEKAADKSENVTNKAQGDKDKSAQKNVESKNVATPDKSKGDKNASKTEKGADKSEKNAQKADKTAEKSDKNAQKADKSAEKPEKNAQKADKSAERPEKTVQKADKSAEKPEKNVQKADKSAEKLDKNAEKTDKSADKPTDNKNEKGDKKEESRGDASGKDKQPDRRQNGKPNGVGRGAGAGDDSTSDSSSDEALTIDEHDEMFPELAYDDGSEPDCESDASRSLTRRSQVKVTKTPDTPRPLSVKEEEPKDSKVLKMNDSLVSDRKLRSSDSPKPESKKEDKKKEDEREDDKTIDLTEDGEGAAENGDTEEKGKRKLELDVVVDNECLEGEPRAAAAAASGPRTRARVSPYSRAARAEPPAAPAGPAHDQTASSLAANYTGNNTTMEMDISECSAAEEGAPDGSPYLRGLRNIRGRSSYKPLKELALKHTLNTSARSNASVNTSLCDWSRPTGTVVGRKRKPDADADADADEAAELAQEAASAEPAAPEPRPALPHTHTHSKRMRLFDGLSVPFRGFPTHTATEIVGINTDLPLSAPVASAAAFDPERLKADPLAVPLAPAHRQPAHDRDGKRCAIM